MALLNTLVLELASRAGWKNPSQDEDGAYRFSLENDLDFAIFSPDDRNAILRAELMPVPAPGPDRDDLMRDVARRQAAVCRSRASIASMEGAGQSLLKGTSASGDALVLYNMVALAGGQAALAAAAKNFLNDLAWWKASFDDGRAQNSRARPLFTMPGSFSTGMY